MNYLILNKTVAQKFGINIALILNDFVYWDGINKANKSAYHYRDGKYWIYYSCKSLAEHLGSEELEDGTVEYVVTPRQIQTAIDKMINDGLIEVSEKNYNQSKFDQTKWYSVTEKGLSFFVTSIQQNVKYRLDKTGNSIQQNVRPIPNDNHKDNTNDNHFSAAPAHGNINATPASPNIRPNFKSRTSDDMREIAWIAWQETIKQKKIPFTEFELGAIKAYAYSKPTMPAFEIESNLTLLDKWAIEGLDIENSLRQSLSTKALIRPTMRKEHDSKGNRIYHPEQLNNIRNNQINIEQTKIGAKNEMENI